MANQVSIEEKKKAIQAALYYLTQKEPFLGGMLQELTLRFEENIPAIAGISYNKKTKMFDIMLHDTLFPALQHQERMAVMMHEILHFLHQHLFRLPFLSKDKTPEERAVMNFAGDMAINQLIHNLPEGCVDVKLFHKDDGTPFPLMRTMEEYYELLQTNQKNNKHLLPQPGEGGKGKFKVKIKGAGPNGEDEEVQFDLHDWDELTEQEKEEFLNATKKVVQRTMDKTSYSHNELPDYVKDLLKKIDTELVGLDYKRVLKDAIKRNASSSDRESTWKKPNKRFGAFAKGTKLGQQPKLAFFNDSSGSISVQEQNEYLRIMDQFLSVGERKCILAFWHTSLYLVKPYKRGKEVDANEIESGGTDVTCVMDYIKKNKPDLSIILTDGYFDTAKTTPDCEVVWIISKNGNQNHPMKHIGKTILLDKIK